MGTINGVFIYNSAPQNGATAKLWDLDGFASYADSGDTVQDNPLLVDSIELNVSDGTNFAVSDIIKIGTELLKIWLISTNLLYVIRAWRGTTASEHAQTTAINDETITPPAQDADEPGSGQVGGSVTTGVVYGGDGAYRFDAVGEGDYYVSVEYDNHRSFIHHLVETDDPTPSQLLLTRGDILIVGADGVKRLSKGAADYLLIMGANEPEWAAVATAAPGGLATFGDGSDGDVTIAADTPLTRDMFYDNLTVNATKTLTTAGFRIFVKNTLTNNGTIERNGNDAPSQDFGAALADGSLGGSSAGTSGAGSANTPGGGGSGGGIVFIAAKTLNNGSGVISTNGGDGGDGITPQAANNGNGSNGNISTPSLGGAGGASGATTGQTGGAGGAATAPTAVKGGFRAPPLATILKEIETTVAKIKGGAGGAGGAVDDNNSETGGGGGGGGGCVILLSNSLTAGTETSTGGALGNGFGGGSNGVAGSDGTVIKIAN